MRLEEHPPRVVLLDQRRLPDEVVELVCEDAVAVAKAIRALAVRGAPAIGIAAGYGLALAALRGDDLAAAEAVLAGSRPTAVNLFWALERLRAEPTPERARELHREEVDRCRSMAAHAAGLFQPGARALTHCNAGGLATGGYGSAVGALRAAWERGLLEHVLVDETRPLLQGARLTAWELETLGIPHSVIVDSAAASFMARREVDLVVTGADRIAANGDTANKIGTYALAVLAAHHAVPFYVVAPTSTIDPGAASAAAIPIEERDPGEVSSRFPARNPAFDVTPAELIGAIVTERGVHRAPYAETLAASRSWHEGDHPRRRLRDPAAPADRHHPEAAAAGRRAADGRLDRREDPGGRRSPTCTSSRTRASPRTSRAGPQAPVSRSTTTDDDERGPPRRDRRHPLRAGARCARRRPSRDRRRQPLRLLARGLRRLLAGKNGASALAVHDVGDRELAKQYGIVDVDAEGRVIAFVEKPEQPPSTLAATATYLYSREHARLVATYLADGNPPDQPGNFIAWLHTRAPVYAYRFEGGWYDIGDLGQLLEADNRLRESAGLPPRASYSLDAH